MKKYGGRYFDTGFVLQFYRVITWFHFCDFRATAAAAAGYFKKVLQNTLPELINLEMQRIKSLSVNYCFFQLYGP